MKRVRIVQLLCPARHCIMALAYQTEDGAVDIAQSVALALAHKNGPFHSHCGICLSPELHIEDSLTVFETMEAAMPMLLEIERGNANSRARHDRMRNN